MEHLNADTIELFRLRLEEIVAELSATLEKNSEATAPVQLDTSIGRLSRMDAIQSQQIALGMKTRQQQALLRARNALEAIKSGTYGQCRRCKGPIGFERLDAQPDTMFCVKCVAKK